MATKGNKANDTPDIVPILQRCIYKYRVTTYVEPFFDGFRTIAQIDCENRVGNSNNAHVIEKAERHRDNQPANALQIHGVLLGCCDYRCLRFPTSTTLIYCRKALRSAAFWQWCRDNARAGHVVFVRTTSAPPDFASAAENVFCIGGGGNV